MRVAMVTETWPPEVNGVARTLAIVAEGLRGRGHEIAVTRPRQGVADQAMNEEAFSETLLPGMPIPRYPQLRLGLPAKGALLAAWRNKRPDLVHIATEGPLGWSALSAARALGIPLASDFRTNFHAYSGHYGFGWIARPVIAYLRGFHNRTARTMVPTEEMARDLGRLGFERLRVVGRGVDTRTFSPAKRDASLRRAWQAGEDAPVALCVGRFAPEKNLPLVVEAFRAMRASNGRARLVLVGDGPLAGDLRHVLAGDPGCILVNGRLDDDELSAYYASADVFLFPSATETFGNVTLEAMASGLAIVACDYAAARQHLVHGRSGLLAPLGDREAFIAHAVALAVDLPRARSLGRHARESAEQVGWDRIVREFEEVLRDAIATSAPSSPTAEAQHAAA